MKKNTNFKRLCVLMALIMAITCAVLSGALAEQQGSAPANDSSPAIYVAQSTANSVVGVTTYEQTWDRSTRETQETPLGYGSGVVIKEGGYVLTNYHVVEGGSSYKVLLPSGEYTNATLVGSDSSTDLAVLKAEDADGLVPVTVGSSSALVVGSTAIAIGNPGGEVLANTVTQGIVSALERESVNSSNTSRSIAYIQHDAAINSGNSGGGLFNAAGELIGINTLKYSGSRYSSVTFEGLGFAIPIDTAYPVAMDLIEHGKVLRPQMGVTVLDYTDGPDEPMNNYPPMSVMVYTVNEGSPAQAAGVQPFDFITHIDGVRVTSLFELTKELDKHQEGDTVELTVARYANAQQVMGYLYGMSNSSSSDDSDSNYGNNYGYDYGYGNYGNYFGNYNNRSSMSLGSYDTLKLKVTLEIPKD